MSDEPVNAPALATRAHTVALRGQFHMSSEPKVGALLRALAASKPGGRFLEIGTGLGVGAAWILDGMDADARLVTVEVSERVAELARRILAVDDRVEVVTADADEWLTQYAGPPFDLVFVDTTSTKFDRRHLIYRHLKGGALFIGDDLLPQDKWSDSHPERVERFRQEIVHDPCLVACLVDWATGVLVSAFRPPSAPLDRDDVP